MQENGWTNYRREWEWNLTPITCPIVARFRALAVSAEMIAILAFGVMLAGLVFTTGSWIRDDLQVLRNDVRDVQYGLGELRERVVRVETAGSELDERMTRVESAVSELGERMTRVESALGELGERVTSVESGLGELGERVVRVESLLQQDSARRLRG